MKDVAIVCAYCGAQSLKASGGVYRSQRAGSPLYCNRACAGLARRHDTRTDEQKRADKAEYDRQYRARLGEAALEKKRQEYRNRLARDPVGLRAAQKSLRQRRKQDHAEYIRSPRYREWKAKYDLHYLANKQFGAFGEAAIILNQLEAEIRSRATWVEVARAKGTLGKTQERKRDYARKTGHAQRG